MIHMKEENASITTSLEYAHMGDLSVQLLGTHPKSINGLSPLALLKIIYPDKESEEVMMDLVTKQYYVSHGYTLKLNDINIGTSYLPWKKMFSGTVKVTALSEDKDNEKDSDVEAAEMHAASVHPCTCETDNNIATVIKNGKPHPSLSVVSSPDGNGIQAMQPNGVPLAMMSVPAGTGIHTMQTPGCGNCSYYNNGYSGSGYGGNGGNSGGNGGNPFFQRSSDTSILAIVLGLISLGLLGLAFALVKKRE